MRRLEGALVWLFFFALIFPVTYSVGPIGVPAWLLPVAALMFWRFIAASLSGDDVVFNYNIEVYDVAVMVFCVATVTSTIVSGGVSKPLWSNLTIYLQSLLLAIFVRQTWGGLFTEKRISSFVVVFLVIEFVVSILQIQTGEPIGNLSATLGESQLERLRGGRVWQMYGIGRVIGTLGSSPNILGHAIVALLPLLVLSRKRNRGSIRWGTKLTLLVMIGFGVTVATLSRSSIIGMSVIIALGALSVVKRGVQVILARFAVSRSVIGVIVSIVIVSGIVGVGLRSFTSIGVGLGLVKKAVSTRIGHVVSEEQGFQVSPGIKRRLAQADAGLNMFYERPLVGHGYYSSERAGEYDNSPEGVKAGRIHNAFLAFLAEGGIVAFLSLIIIAVYPILSHIKLAHRSSSGLYIVLACGLIVLLLQTSSAYDAPALAPLFALIWGVSMGVANEKRSQYNPLNSSGSK